MFANSARFSDATYGPLISVLTTGGLDKTKQGNLHGTWVDEFYPVSQIADAG